MIRSHYLLACCALICLLLCLLFTCLFTDVSDPQELDPLADATYIRANFTYIPRNPKELSIKTEDVFHIHDEVKENM